MRAQVSLLLAIAACSSGSGEGGDAGVDVGAPSPADAAASADGGGQMDSSIPRDASVDAATDVELGLDAVADGAGDADSSSDGGDDTGADSGGACTTTITYGSAWIHAPNHPAQYDVVDGLVSWDGTCTDHGSNSSATLSNGFAPSFSGNGACIIALDYSGACAGVPSACTTRVTYGSAWIPPANHATSYDDVTGRVYGDGICHGSGAQSVANLSNGWTPNFQGSNSCSLSFEYRQCGGLYTNAVIPTDCPDPGVLHDGNQYVLTCTSGDAADAYPIYTSPDLASWKLVGHVFPSGHRPSWAMSDFWAPEIHRVGSQYVVYFSARGADGRLAVGAASASNVTGPFSDIGHPLVEDPSLGLIDASEITTSDGTPYALWKVDGNAAAMPTPIRAQPLTPDGLTLTGSPITLITNDQASWEGGVVEGPFMVERSGTFFLFYSGNSYANATYAVGVASAPSPLGPFTKASAPIVSTGGAWVGPGHCSVVDTPAGDTAMVYHAWQQNCVNAPGCGRLDLVDQIVWGASWPSVPLAPSSTTRPLW